MQSEVTKKDAEWYSAHKDYKNRQQIMNQFIESAYPGGLQIKNDLGEVVGMKADPYVVAHMAYEYADKISGSAKKTVEEQNNQRIAAGRSLNAGTQGTVPSQTVAQNLPKKDALAEEASRVFDQQVAPALSRSR